MSNIPKRPYARMLSMAEAIVEKLQPHCERVEIAGSLRRKCDMVGDVELVAIPKTYEVQTDLFGETETHSHLDDAMNEWMDAGYMQHATPRRWGSKLKAFVIESSVGKRYKFDLFIQPNPATWSCNIVTRTGSADFSHWMVTSRSMGGALPDHCKWKNARIWQNGNPVDLPKERDLFAFLKLDYIPPEKREKGRWGLFS